MSSNYTHKLQSEKYIQASLKEEKRLARKAANATAEGKLFNFCMFVLAFAAGYYVYQAMPAWMPWVQSTFHQVTNYRFM